MNIAKLQREADKRYREQQVRLFGVQPPAPPREAEQYVADMIWYFWTEKKHGHRCTNSN